VVDSCNESLASAYARHMQATKRTRTRLTKLVADDPEDAADAADAAALEDSEEAYKRDDAGRRARASSGGSAVAGSHEVRTGKHKEDCVGSNTRGPATDASTGRLLTCRCRHRAASHRKRRRLALHGPLRSCRKHRRGTTQSRRSQGARYELALPWHKPIAAVM
jgi:hypothetical protein